MKKILFLTICFVLLLPCMAFADSFLVDLPVSASSGYSNGVITGNSSSVSWVVFDLSGLTSGQSYSLTLGGVVFSGSHSLSVSLSSSSAGNASTNATTIINSLSNSNKGTYSFTADSSKPYLFIRALAYKENYDLNSVSLVGYDIPSPFPEGFYSVTIPCGNVLQLSNQRSDIDSYDFSASFSSHSWLVNYNGYVVQSDSPVTEFSYTQRFVFNSGGLFGLRQGTRSYHRDTSKEYFYFVNPSVNTQFNNGGVSQGSLNPSVIVQVPYGVTAKVFSLYNSPSLNPDDGIIDYSGTIVDDSSVVDYDSFSGTSSGTPSIGGVNPPDITSVENGDETLFQTVISYFDNFFSRGSNAIQHIIDSSSNFFNTLRGLFSWLPTDVSSMAVDCLIAIFVIGLIKVLL